MAGLGPRFRLSLHVRNEGGRQLAGLPVALRANAALYGLSKSHFVIPFLVPGLQYTFEVGAVWGMGCGARVLWVCGVCCVMDGRSRSRAPDGRKACERRQANTFVCGLMYHGAH